MAKPDKVDWVALIDQVWDQENNDIMVTEDRLESTESPLLRCTPQNKQMKLCIEKVSASSDTLRNEDPLKQTFQEPEQSTIASTCVKTPKCAQSHTRQMDILGYLDKVYNTCTETHTEKTPRKALVSSPFKKVHTPLDNSLSEIGSEARKLFPTGSEEGFPLERNNVTQESNHKRYNVCIYACACVRVCAHVIVMFYIRKRKRNTLNTVELNEQPTKRAKAGRTKKGIKKENDEQLYLVSKVLEKMRTSH